MLELTINLDEYKQIIEENSKYKKTLEYLKETLSGMQTLDCCTCPQCKKIKEINSFIDQI